MNSVGSALKSHALILGGTLAVFWAVFIVDSLLGGALLRFGVIPRTTIGLRGIVFGPFLHASLDHIVANSIPLLVLGWMVIFGYLGFLMLSGWYTRSFDSIVLSAAVTVVWGSLVLGMMPGAPGISWQAHAGGFIGGVLAARAFRVRAGRTVIEAPRR